MNTPTQPPSDSHDSFVESRDDGAPRKSTLRQHGLPWIILIVVIVAIIVVTVIVSVQAEDGDSRGTGVADDVAAADEADEEALTILEEAAEFAGAGDIGDEGASLFLDGEGDDVASGTVTIDEIVSALVWAEAPDHVITVMSQTRAMDGMQSAEWETESQGTVAAQWTYHPDNGLDIILTVEPSDGVDT